MFASERHQAILRLVRRERRLDFPELLKQINVSPATLRRDLNALERSGDILRVHGGVLDPAYVRSEISLDERLLKNNRAKKRIAALAAALIPPGSTVLVDAGSTCLEAGRALLGRRDIQIITHSVALLTAAMHGQAALLFLGGELRRVSGAVTGAAALGALESLHADWAFLGASGLDANEGCSTTELTEAALKRTFLDRARTKVLLADHTKWNHPHTVRFAAWTDFDHWVTDTPPPPPDNRRLAAAGLSIHS